MTSCLVRPISGQVDTVTTLTRVGSSELAEGIANNQNEVIEGSTKISENIIDEISQGGQEALLRSIGDSSTRGFFTSTFGTTRVGLPLGIATDNNLNMVIDNTYTPLQISDTTTTHALTFVNAYVNNFVYAVTNFDASFIQDTNLRYGLRTTFEQMISNQLRVDNFDTVIVGWENNPFITEPITTFQAARYDAPWEKFLVPIVYSFDILNTDNVIVKTINRNEIVLYGRSAETEKFQYASGKFRTQDSKDEKLFNAERVFEFTI